MVSLGSDLDVQLTFLSASASPVGRPTLASSGWTNAAARSAAVSVAVAGESNTPLLMACIKRADHSVAVLGAGPGRYLQQP